VKIMAKCSFCGEQIEKGTGKMLVYVSGKIDYFCSTKCEKNMLKLGRKPTKARWTAVSQAERKKGKGE